VAITSEHQRYLTPQEVADVLRMSRKTIYRWIAAGDLRVVQIGRGPRARLRIDADDLAAYIDRGRKARPTESNP
jgi:excisionase family DNA binding protein